MKSYKKSIYTIKEVRFRSFSFPFLSLSEVLYFSIYFIVIVIIKFILTSFDFIEIEIGTKLK